MPVKHSLLSCLLFCCLLLTASDALCRTVRVGFFPLPGFMEQNEEGRLTGYGVDFLQELGRQTGWAFDYVYTPQEQQQRMLERGDIDMLGPLRPTPALRGRFAFPDYPAGSVHTVLYTCGSSTRFASDDYAQFNGLRVGMLSDEDLEKHLELFSRQQQFRVTLERFPTETAMEDALRANAIDAVLTSSLYRKTDKNIIARFAPDQFYFAVRRDAPALLQELNHGLAALQMDDPMLPLRLYDQYYGQLRNNLIFTRQENDALQQQIVLRAVCCGAWPPLVQPQPQGEPTGVIPNIINKIGKDSGCTFRISMAENFATAVKMLEEGKADVLCDFTGQNALFSKNRLSLSPPYLRLPLILLARKDRAPDVPWRTAAIPVDHEYFLYEKLRNRQGLAPIYCETAEASLNAVAVGKADVTICNLRTANLLLQRPEFAKLEDVGMCAEQGELRLAFAPTLPPALISALNKVVLHLPPEALEHALMVSGQPDTTPLPPWFPWLCAALLLGVAVPLTWFAAGWRQETRARDPLSGLPMLPAFRARAGKLLRRPSTRQPAIVCLHVQDIGGINEQHGQACGDAVLRRVGTLLHAEMREGELAGKFASSYFLMLLRHDGQESLEMRLNTLNTHLRKLSHCQEFPFPIISSMGVCLPAQEKNINATIDCALKISRTTANPHKNTYAFNTDMPSSSTMAVVQQQLTADRGNALITRQFTAYFQQKIDLATGGIIGAEALARWRHPQLGLLDAAEFLPLFEANGFIQTLDMFILEDVCQKLQLLTQDPLLPVLPIACNVSHLHFQDEHFASRLLLLAERCHTPPALLMLDIAEETALKYFDLVCPAVRQLQQAGFLICLEHFGAQAAPLRLLTELHPTEVKLSPALLQEAMLRPSGEALLHACLSTAKTLGISVVAGAVEQQEQADFLLRQHVCYAQGFLFGRPQPFTDCLNLPDARRQNIPSASQGSVIYTTPPTEDA